MLAQLVDDCCEAAGTGFGSSPWLRVMVTLNDGCWVSTHGTANPTIREEATDAAALYSGEELVALAYVLRKVLIPLGGIGGPLCVPSVSEDVEEIGSLKRTVGSRVLCDLFKFAEE